MKRLGVKDLLLLVATLASVAGGVFWVWSENVVQRVFLVNRLGAPVELSIDGRVHALPLAALVPVSLSRGVHQVKVTAGGRVLEEGPIAVPGSSNALVYDVLGVAPLYEETVYYGTGAGLLPERFEFYGGQRLVNPGHVDFVFTPPSRSISVDSSAKGPQGRSHLDIGNGGWRETVSVLRDRGARDAALRVCLDVSRARPDDAEPLLAAADLLAALRGPEAAIAVVRGRLEADPDDYEAHRAHQHYLRLAGRADEALAYYRAFRAAWPGEALPAALLARVEAPEAALALYEEALRLDPQSAPARRGLAHLRFTQGRLDDAVRLLAEMAKDDPEYPYYLDEHVRALLGCGRPAEAVSVAARACEKSPTDWRPAVLYAQLAATAGVSAEPRGETFVDRIAKKAQDPEYAAWMRSLAGVASAETRLRKVGPPPGSLATAALIQQAAAQDPASAWALCAKADGPALDRLGSPVAVLLAAEFLRAGDRQTAYRLFAAHGALSLPARVLEDYVSGGVEGVDLWRLAPEERAALDFVRSRRVAGDAAARAALVAAARRREAVRGPVTRAIESWPPPRPNDRTVTLRRRQQG